ncbi:MAG: ArsR family transcriptional regulator [Candidatus Hodarchaeales archaeon]
MKKVPTDLRNQILALLETPKKIRDISEEIEKSKKISSHYLRIMLQRGEIKKVVDFRDLRSFFYVAVNEIDKSAMVAQ